MNKTPHYRAPTALERQQLYSALRRASSLAAWQIACSRYYDFYNVVRHAFDLTYRQLRPQESPQIDVTHMKALHEGRLSFESAIHRLERGDRSCFHRNTIPGPGTFAHAQAALHAFYEEWANCAYLERGEFPPEYLPEWPKIQTRMESALEVLRELNIVIRSSGYFDSAYPTNPDVYFADQSEKRFLCHVFASDETPLPEVPAVEPPVFVQSRKIVPHTGIWEPCRVEYDESFGGLKKRIRLAAEYPIEGCMHYLHQGQYAPRIGFPGDKKHLGKSTTWRLIWIDDRYGKHPIPAEEENYDLIAAGEPTAPFRSIPYRIPTIDERKALFEGLRQQSSLTTWKHLFDRYCHFLNILRISFERSQMHPLPEYSRRISASDMSLLYRCQAAFEHALRRLDAGDRGGFAWAYQHGHFVQGMRGLSTWRNDFERSTTGFPPFSPSALPEWPSIGARMDEFFEAASFAMHVLQPQAPGLPARLHDPDTHFHIDKHGPVGHLSEIYHRGADKLPEVPIVDPPVLVRTGQTVPHDGIWEPCEVQYTPGFHGLFVKPILPADTAQIPIDGCMNYLLAGHPAPTIAFPEDKPRREGKSTTWRLIWIDDRYGKNPIPAEEANYELKPLSADPT